MNFNKFKIPARVIAFATIALLLVTYLGKLFQPVWLDWNNYNTLHGFYEEPENTIETVFLGSSVMINGISPMVLYEDYGMCSYNLRTEQQPMLISYYWLEEAYKHHSQTMKNGSNVFFFEELALTVGNKK